jgi:hypothetical protein
MAVTTIPEEGKVRSGLEEDHPKLNPAVPADMYRLWPNSNGDRTFRTCSYVKRAHFGIAVRRVGGLMGAPPATEPNVTIIPSHSFSPEPAVKLSL